MAEVRAKTLEFHAAIDPEGRFCPEGSQPVELGEDWNAEALVLAGLLKCSLTSLAYHAKRTGVEARGRGDARGEITKRESDGRYALVRIDCNLDVELEPEPGADDVKALLFKGERDCFIAASLTVKPTYHWRVNGRELT